MIKIIPPNSWSWAFDGPQLETVKFASHGLRGHDLGAFIKRASHPQADWVRRNPPKPGEVYVHNIGLGATEKVGLNRNADGYTNAMLARDHTTFEKMARFYQDHKNNDPSKSYGIVKHSHHNPDLGRVDLITALNATKEAADRNGGLVAEYTLNKMASGLDVAVSQSCKVPTDVCLSCGNVAKHRAEYCGPERCKYGGCRDNLGRVFDDGFHMGVDNPKCGFFDLSDVSRTRGADRTAFLTGKVASSEKTIGGAELAEMMGLVAPDHILDPKTMRAAACLRKLAAFRYPVDAVAPSWDDCVAVRSKIAAYTRNSIPSVSGDELARHDAVRDMAAAGVVLPPAAWLALVTGVDRAKCAAVFAGGINPDRHLLDRHDFHEIVESTTGPAETDSRVSRSRWGYLAPTKIAHARESALGVLAGPRPVVKTAADATLAAEMKARYLAYQGKTLAAHENSPDFLLILADCARHNRSETY